MSSIIKTIAILLLFTFQSFGAANWHVRRAATGTGSGADWNNAYTALPATLIRGDTYYIAAGSYSAYIFDDANSGTSYITVKRATVADHGSATGWSDAYGTETAIFTNGIGIACSYLILDGQTGGGPGNWETGHGFNSSVSGAGAQNFYITNPRSNITIKNFNAQNQGQTSTLLGTGTNQNIFYASTGNTPSYMTFQSNFWHDVSICAYFMRAADNITVEYSKFARVGNSGTNPPYGPVDDEHREFWSGTEDCNITIRHCIFENINNTAVIGLVNGNGVATNWQFYGNVIVQNSITPVYNAFSSVIDVKNDRETIPQPTPLRTSIYANNWKIYNNTIVGTPNSTSSAGFNIGGGSNNICYNNLFYTNIANSIAFWNLNAGYNWFFDNRRYQNFIPPDYGNLDQSTPQANKTIGNFIPLVDWRAGNFLPTAPITGASNLALAPGFFDLVDAYGRTRGADGVLDSGAYEYVAGGTPPTPPPSGGGTTANNTVFILRVGL